MEHLLTNLSLDKIGLLIIGIVGVVMVGFMVYHICYGIICITGAICSGFKFLRSSREAKENREALPLVGHLGITLPDGGHPKRKEEEKETGAKHQLKTSTCNCNMTCLTESRCVRVGGQCQTLNMDNHTCSLCLGNAPANCPYSTLIDDSYYCKCPIGQVLVKNFYKDVDDRLSLNLAVWMSHAVQMQH